MKNLNMSLEDKYKTIINKPSFHILNLFFSFISIIYRIILSFRKILYKFHILKTNIYRNVFIISIGNITLGGTGKTPMVKKFIEILKNLDNKNIISVISRGYKRKSKKDEIISSNSLTNIKDIGDENFMLKQNSLDFYLGVGKNKSKIISKMITIHPEVKYFIIDDGFQNLSIKKNLNILLLDASKNFLKYKLFPRGLLREPLKNIKKADMIILTKCNISQKNDINIIKENLNKFGFNEQNKNILLSEYIPINFINLENKNFETSEFLKFLKNKKINSLSGIGDPDSFSKILESLKIKITKNFIFPDHYWLTTNDIEKSLINSDILLTTEKDFVKIKELFLAKLLNFHVKDKIFFLNMDIMFDEASYRILSQKLLN